VTTTFLTFQLDNLHPFRRLTCGRADICGSIKLTYVAAESFRPAAVFQIHYFWGLKTNQSNTLGDLFIFKSTMMDFLSVLIAANRI
jgi:hypothetical protein